jgi:hypothetical protein
MLAQIRDLLQTAQTREKLRSASTHAEAVEVLTRAGAARGLTAESVSRALDGLSASPRELTEEELLGVSGGMAGDTHVHMSCCNDCPTREPN